MQVYKNVKNIKITNNQTLNSAVVSQQKLRFFGVVFLLIITSGIFGFSLTNLGLCEEVKNITASWSPSVPDLGKLKFVDKQNYLTDQEVSANISAMEMPFENTFVEQTSTGEFIVNGLGGLIVKSCLGGKVNNIAQNGSYKKVTVSHGKGLISIYDMLDNVTVKLGDKIEKNTPLGISLTSKIKLTVLFKDKLIAGLTVVDGEMTFM